MKNMAKRAIVPFSEDKKNDLIETLRYIQSIRDEEAKLKAKREQAEAWLSETLGVDAENEGTTHFGDEDNFVTVEVRRTWSVDADALQSMVEAQEVSMDTVNRVISWKPSLKVTEWRVLDEDSRKVLSQAVTSKTGKPSIKINIKEA